MSTPGMLAVTMQPKPGLPPAQFHEWYNNEHGPTRLRIPAIFANGLRYRAADDQQPEFLAAYDVARMSHLETDAYTTLRANRSPREAETIGQVDVMRHFWDLVSEKKSPLFLPIEQLTDDEAAGLQLVVVELGLKDHPDAETELLRWYNEEHAEMLSKVPGWLRTRLFKTSVLDTKGGARTIFYGVHDYTKENGLGGPEHKASMATPWRVRVTDNYATLQGRRIWSLFYTFGPAPRDLASLSELPAVTSTFQSADGKTKTTNNNSDPAIESFVTLPSDGLVVPYRLEGNPDPQAPVIAFCNSLLTSLHMWDGLVSMLETQRPQYKILRYDARGRRAVPHPPQPATLEMHADDLAGVLEALRIPRLAALVGVSMGGATTLKFALRHGAKVDKFIACDFNAASSEANTSAWKERITLAESTVTLDDGTTTVPGIQKLAGATVQRWFHPNTGPETVQWMTDMVAANDVEGFRYGCQALWDYNMKEEMRECAVPGLLVVGEGDGKGALVKAMDGFRGNLGEKGAELAVVPETGHLPMAENPQAFWDKVQGFL
ncbi:uncharacterized protein PG986_008591 [Apiospora aurea]|uniref:AB hydrolase-1 domain-containing protein n=1 Tax=Apiospora aurea TaxID=335848 RepID=A0ABR1Q597_9PEZI